MMQCYDIIVHFDSLNKHGSEGDILHVRGSCVSIQQR